jgi:hypothetical protein
MFDGGLEVFIYILYNKYYFIPFIAHLEGKEMPNDTLQYLSDKTEHDLLVILEGFKMLLADADLFDMLALKLDYPDEMLIELRDDVSKFMEDALVDIV